MTHLTWGAANLSKDSDTRKAYLKAVKQADNNEYQPILDFAKS